MPRVLGSARWSTQRGGKCAICKRCGCGQWRLLAGHVIGQGHRSGVCRARGGFRRLECHLRSTLGRLYGFEDRRHRELRLGGTGCALSVLLQIPEQVSSVKALVHGVIIHHPRHATRALDPVRIVQQIGAALFAMKRVVLRAIHVPKTGGTSIAWTFDSERRQVHVDDEWTDIATACHAASAHAFQHSIVQMWHHCKTSAMPVVLSVVKMVLTVGCFP